MATIIIIKLHCGITDSCGGTLVGTGEFDAIDFCSSLQSIKRQKQFV